MNKNIYALNMTLFKCCSFLAIHFSSLRVKLSNTLFDIALGMEAIT